MVSIPAPSPAPPTARGGPIDVDIIGDTSGFVTGAPPNVATGDLDADVDVPNPRWTVERTDWSIADAPDRGVATIDSNGTWQYTVDPAFYASLDPGEIATDTFLVVATSFVRNPGGRLFTAQDTETVTIKIEGVCFVLGTLISTPEGAVPVETLKAGDLVETLDHGPQPIRWIESATVAHDDLKEHPRLRPVRIKPDALAPGQPARPLYVSQQHRVLVRGRNVELLFGTPEVLVAAKALCGRPGIDIDTPDGDVSYFHVLLDRHEILTADGAPAESLHLGEEALVALSSEGLLELNEIFGEPSSRKGKGAATSARPVIRPAEARALV